MWIFYPYLNYVILKFLIYIKDKILSKILQNMNFILHLNNLIGKKLYYLKYSLI